MQQGVASNALILNDQGKFLIIKRSDDDKYFPGSWELPGGGMDADETPQEGLEREVLEECGLWITIGMPVGVHIFYLDTDKIKVTEITFLCTQIQQNQSVKLSYEHSDYRWVSLEEFRAMNASEYMQQVVRDAFANPLIKQL